LKFFIEAYRKLPCFYVKYANISKSLCATKRLVVPTFFCWVSFMEKEIAVIKSMASSLVNIVKALGSYKVRVGV
jgi:hypothetical protein